MKLLEMELFTIYTDFRISVIQMGHNIIKEA